MKNFKDSFLEHAHLFILALTLIISCTGWTAMHVPKNADSSFAWFGYVPASVQYAADTQNVAADHVVSTTVGHQGIN
jgi:cytochrome b561